MHEGAFRQRLTCPYDEASTGPAQGWCRRHRYRREKGSPDSPGFLRNKNAALPVRAQKGPLTLRGLQKMGPGWHQRPRTFAPQASVMATGVWDDVGYEYTCFMRGGEDARLHERFLVVKT